MSATKKPTAAEVRKRNADRREQVECWRLLAAKGKNRLAKAERQRVVDCLAQITRKHWEWLSKKSKQGAKDVASNAEHNARILAFFTARPNGVTLQELEQELIIQEPRCNAMLVRKGSGERSRYFLVLPSTPGPWSLWTQLEVDRSTAGGAH